MTQIKNGGIDIGNGRLGINDGGPLKGRQRQGSQWMDELEVTASASTWITRASGALCDLCLILPESRILIAWLDAWYHCVVPNVARN